MFKYIMLPALVLGFSIAQADVIEERLKRFNIENPEIIDSPISGIKTVLTPYGIFYATEDGRFFLQGTLVEIKEDGALIDWNIRPLLGKMATMEEDMIVFQAPEEKYVVTVFNDISCYYCQLLHKEMADYHKHGITIRYLAFPRTGVGSEIGKKMAYIWQAEDRKERLDRAMHDFSDVPQSDDLDLVQNQYDLGVLMGVRGTPAMVLPNGRFVEGYRNAKELINLLESQ